MEPQTSNCNRIISSKVYFENLFYAVLNMEIRKPDKTGAVGVEDPIKVIGKSLRLIFSRFIVFDAVLCVAGIKVLPVVRLP